MSTSKEREQHSTVRPVLLVFCTFQFIAFIGLTVYETQQRLVLQKNLELKQTAILNISTRCLSYNGLQEEVATITRLKRAAERYFAKKQASGSNPDQNFIKTEETLLEKTCSNDTKICLKGLKGESGIPGDKGDAGVMGSVGTNGQKGLPGALGLKGLSGPNGNPGIKGAMGLKGSIGPQGIPGQKGEPGANGIVGQRGSIGRKGTKGEIGVHGQNGDTGIKGSKGDKGEQGPPGVKGENGPAGKIGEVGENGTSSIRSSNTSCDCIKKVRFSDTRTTISAPLGSQIRIDCSTSPSIPVNITHSSEQQCYVENGSGIITIERLSSVDVGDHYCTVNNGFTDVVKVIHINATDSSDGLSCDFENPSCPIKFTSWKTIVGPNDHTVQTGNGHFIQSIGQKFSSLESLWMKKKPLTCFSFWYQSGVTGPSPLGNIYIEIQEPHCVNHTYRMVIPINNDVTTWREVSVYVPQSFDLFKVLVEVNYSNLFVSIDDLRLYPDGCPNRLRFQNPDNETIEIAEGDILNVKCDYNSGVQGISVNMTKEGSCTFPSKSTFHNYSKPLASFSDSGKYVCQLKKNGKHVEKYIDVVVTGNHSCTFEHGLCDWKQDRNDALDWTSNSGNTNSRNTGPSGDHTFGTAVGKYLYLEASGEQSGEVASLKSKLLSPAHYCLSFGYHMYGVAMGTLRVSTQECDSATKREIWSKSGDQGNTWHDYCQEIPEIKKDFTIYIEGIRGTDFTSDVAIDDISLESIVKNSSCTCSGGSGIIITSCDFDTDYCNWKQLTTDDFDWSRHDGSTPSSDTGPDNDHTTSTGYYIFTEASSPQSQGQKAELESIILSKGSKYCLTFYYHMNGDSMGQLNVLRELTTGSRSSLFRISGNHDTSWHKQQVNIPPSSSDGKIILQGVVGTTFRSDLALDDITISTGDCA